MIQTAALIALFGSLTAVGVPTFLQTVRRSKIAEASTELDRIHRSAAAYYEATHGDTAKLHACVPAAAGPTPDVPSVTPVDVDFHADDTPGSETWKSLGYAPLGPLRFSYSFKPKSAGCDPKAWGALAVIQAEGDLDGDGTRSLFERRLSVTRDHVVSTNDVLLMRDRIE